LLFEDALTFFMVTLGICVLSATIRLILGILKGE